MNKQRKITGDRKIKMELTKEDLKKKEKKSSVQTYIWVFQEN